MRYILTSTLLFFSYLTTGQDRFRKHRDFDIIHYDFEITINDTNNRIEGTTLILAELKHDRVEKIPLNFSLSEKDVKSISTSPHKHSWSNDTLWIYTTKSSPIFTEQKIIVKYKCTPKDGLIFSKTKHGKRTVFADNWPNRAQNWIPVVDHPTEKATCTFDITAPDHYQIIANGLKVQETFENNRIRSIWMQSTVIPTKVMVFGAADFSISPADTVHGIPVNSWIFVDDRDKGFKDYAVATEVLDYYIDKIGPYPFDKLANVQSKTRYGGMENASCIFYSEKSVTGKNEAESLIAHEIAHQWFGNSASEDDWHHLWLSEGFATYLTELYLENKYGQQILKRDMIKMRENIIEFVETNPLSPIIDPAIIDLNDLLNANNYDKGAWVLHMLKNKVGEDKFWQILRTYYNKYEYSNALSPDFIKVAEEISGKKLQSFFNQWLYKYGIPKIEYSWSYNLKKKSLEIKLKQKQKSGLYDLEIPCMLYFKNGQSVTIYLQSNEKSYKFLEITEEVSRVVIDPEVVVLAEFIKK